VRTWDTFFPDVLPEVLGCPEPSVERALLRAAQELCRKTRCWRADLDPITTNGVAEFELFFPTGAAAHQFVGATFNGQDIGLEVVDETSTGDRRNGTGGSTRLLTWDKRNVTMMPPPAAGGILVVTAILVPSETATGIADAIADDYRDEIATGALSRLLATNKAEWANPVLAREKAEQFKDACARIQTQVWKAHTNRRPRARAQFF
jgi:hypothetical protein